MEAVTDMFKDRVRELRLEKGLKQEEIANSLGVVRTTYTKYETGEREPSFEIMSKLANFFDVSIDYLIGRVDRRELTVLTDLPQSLRKAGWSAIELTMEAIKSGLSPDDISELLRFAKSYKRKK